MSGSDDDLLSRLAGRRSAPGMLDIDTLRAGRDRFASPGLGLARSADMARLLARGGGGGPAVASGELIYRTAAAPTGEAPPTAVGSAVAPDKVGIPVVRGRTSAIAGSGSPAPRTGPDRVADATNGFEVPVGGDGALSVSPTSSVPVAPAEAGAPAQSILPSVVPSVPVVAGEVVRSLTGDVDDDASGSALILAHGRVVEAASGVAAGAVGASDGPVLPLLGLSTGQPGIPGTRARPGPMMPSAVTSPTAVSDFPRTGAAPEFDELTEQIARDLRRRLMVERERQGIPRWKK